MTKVTDDGIVVWTRPSMTTHEYLYDTEETNRRRELARGILREPPAPFWSHQQLVLHIARRLLDHVEANDLGLVGVAPVDVILDEAKALILQPDVLFVAKERREIVRDQVWGAPDLVVEVLSAGMVRRDRTEKLGWYRQYGVRECWLVDLGRQQVTIVDFSGGLVEERIARGPQPLRSSVLPEFILSAYALWM